ncbi:NAD(P)H-dependent oxidoreductase [Nocardia heshunensis]
MTGLLHISSSPFEELSESIKLARSFLTGYRESHPDAVIDQWDLWQISVSDIRGAATSGKMNAPTDVEVTEQQAHPTPVQDMVSRFNSYEHLLFSVPLWNHELPYILNLCSDLQIGRPGPWFVCCLQCPSADPGAGSRSHDGFPAGCDAPIAQGRGAARLSARRRTAE